MNDSGDDNIFNSINQKISISEIEQDIRLGYFIRKLSKYGVAIFDKKSDFDFGDVISIFILNDLMKLNYTPKKITKLYNIFSELGYGGLSTLKRYLIGSIHNKDKLYLLVPIYLEGDFDIVFCSDLFFSEIIAGTSPYVGECGLYVGGDSFITVNIARIIERIIGKTIFNKKSILSEIISDIIDENSDSIKIDMKRKVIEKNISMDSNGKFTELRKKYLHSDIKAVNYNGKTTKYEIKEKIRLNK